MDVSCFFDRKPLCQNTMLLKERLNGYFPRLDGKHKDSDTFDSSTCPCIWRNIICIPTCITIRVICGTIHFIAVCVEKKKVYEYTYNVFDGLNAWGKQTICCCKFPWTTAQVTPASDEKKKEDSKTNKESQKFKDEDIDVIVDNIFALAGTLKEMNKSYQSTSKHESLSTNTDQRRVHFDR